MKLAWNDITTFADWSGDVNPIHVDPDAAARTAFGRPIAHGMLSVIQCLAEANILASTSVPEFKVEFRGAVLPDSDYSTAVERLENGQIAVHLRRNELDLVSVRLVGDGSQEASPNDCPPALGEAGVVVAHPLSSPANIDVDELLVGREIRGTYATGEIPHLFAGHPCLAPVQLRTLGLCSYLVGMQLPGLRSLFTKLNIRFANIRSDSGLLHFRVRITGFEKTFRLLDLALTVTTPDGQLVATAEVRSYVRFSPIISNLSKICSNLQAIQDKLRGKVVLICGGTRGLGADMTAALAMSGCRVIASYRNDASAASELESRLNQHGVSAEFLQGDAGDADWCQQTLATILQKYGRVDSLVLNACAPPSHFLLSSDSLHRFTRFLNENLPLVTVPLTTFAPVLQQYGGTVVAISSSFVDDPMPGFAHYVALKHAVESTIRGVTKEWEQIRGIVVRPPRLLTAWNDSPTGIVGAIETERVALRVVESLAESKDDRLSVITSFPELAAMESDQANEADAESEFEIVLAAAFTADPLLPRMKFWTKELNTSARVRLAPYGQITQELLNPLSRFAKNSRGANVVLLRVADWLHELPQEQARSVSFVRDFLEQNVAELLQAIRAHRLNAKVDTIFCLCASPDHELDEINQLFIDCETSLQSKLGGIPGLQFLRAADFHSLYQVGQDVIHDLLRERVGHIPYQEPYWAFLATVLMRKIYRKLVLPRKAVVVDCDNTLWRGVVGEVGPEGVEFDSSHRALHAKLELLSQNGVLVALCSKNEESDVWSVFDTRPELELPRENLVGAAINWSSKSENLRGLARRLNLGLDSFVFVDDNPIECAEVRANVPEVLTLQWPQDPLQAHLLLEHIWEFDIAATTSEDKQRTKMYREELERNDLRAGLLTFKSFIESLQLVVDIEPVVDDDLVRASQLTLRTNQFNFTTLRREVSELQAIRADGDYQILTVKARDRFGDYGLVGLLIVKANGDVLQIDTFLLSCRVLGRGVEHQMLARAAQVAASRNIASVQLCVIRTKRNSPARSFVESIRTNADVQATADRFECNVPTQELIDLRFDPPDQFVESEDTLNPAPPQQVSTSIVNPREREHQIGRTALELTTPEQLLDAMDGTKRSPQVEILDGQSIKNTVVETFARVLKTTVERVMQVDRLELLGCDSFNIVEITVALSNRFPWLPSTLLFEHQTVSSIVANLQGLQADEQTTKSTESEPAASTSRRREPDRFDIAVTGIDLRCSGANSPEELWDLLSRCHVATTPVPPNRPAFFGQLTDTRSHWAGLLSDVSGFDAEFFGISPREAEQLDPQLRLFLEVAWGAVEDAGLVGIEHIADTGIFVGVMYGDYGYRANEIRQDSTNPYRCWEGFSLANRLSQIMGYCGPSIAVDTACSSSGTAIHLACQALRSGNCRAAVVGGVNLILDPDRFVSLGRLGILSAQGRCLPFAAAADGTILGEGATAIVLRPLHDALERGDRIYGVIKGTGMSTGHGTVGFTAPNPQAQADAIRRSIQDARIDPRTIAYVETHGTGTILGDPIELRGLAVAYGDQRNWDPTLKLRSNCRIASIKGNVGHLEAGAAALGLAKVVMQLDRRQLLPSISADPLNPQIPFDKIPFSVQRDLASWDASTIEINGRPVELPRRAGLNSFGVGGANVHVILEQAPVSTESLDTAPASRPAHVLTLSSRRSESLGTAAAQLRQYLLNHEQLRIEDVCHTLNIGRKHHEHRVALVVKDREHALEQLGSFQAGNFNPGVVTGTTTRDSGRPKVAFLFTGQGSQYPGMMHELYRTEATFRLALDSVAEIMRGHLDRPLLDLMFAAEGSDDAALVHQTGYTQPLLFAFEYALSQLWRSWGVEPSIVIGHSVGEIAALCIAGGVSLEDGVTLITTRGRLMQQMPADGAMFSIMANHEHVLSAIEGFEDRVSIAAFNGPRQVVISGDTTALASIVTGFRTQGIRTKQLQVSHAFHSPMMDAMLNEYESVLQRIRFMKPKIPFVSGVLGAIAAEELQSTDYWVRQVRAPVQFEAGIKTIEQFGARMFVEVGPQPVLLGMAQQCVSEASADLHWIPSARKEERDWHTLLTAMGSLHVNGYPIDWKAFDGAGRYQNVSLPRYHFSHRDYWINRIQASSVGTRIDNGPNVAQRRDDLSRLLYEISWKSWNPEKSVIAPPKGAWLLFVDRNGFGEFVARELGSRGHDVIYVGRGASFVEHDSSRVSIDPSSPEDYKRIEHWLAAKNIGIHGILYCWGLDISPTVPMDGSDGLSTGCEILASLGSVLSIANRLQSSTKTWVTTCGAVVTDESKAEYPVSSLQSLLWGFGRTAALELPACWGGLVDVDPIAVSTKNAEQLVNIIVQSHTEDQFVMRNDVVKVPRLVHSIQRPAPLTRFPTDGAFLVTGGLGALGLHVANWLVKRGVRDLVLMSRRGIADAAAESAVKALLTQGVQVEVVAGDVANPEDVARTLSKFGKGRALRGIVHAAGIDRQTPILDANSDDVAAVLAPKLVGARLLHDQTKHLPIEYFVCFSSISAVIGSTGHAAYGSANAFLDALCGERRRSGLPACSVNWGPWSGGGMADVQSLGRFEQIGNMGLCPQEAAQALETALGNPGNQFVVADIDWNRFLPAYQSRRQSALVAQINPDQAETGESASLTPWVARLRAIPVAQQQAELVELLRDEVARTLGLRQASDIDLRKTFIEMGMDSLLSVDFSSRLQRNLGLKGRSWVFDYPQVDALAERLLLVLHAQLAGAQLAGDEGSTGKRNAEQPPGQQPEWLTQLAAVSVDARLQLMIQLLRGEIATLLGYAQPTDVALTKTFSELGLDSLLAVGFASRLQRVLGIGKSTYVFDYPDIHSLAQVLLGIVDLEGAIVGEAEKQRPAESGLVGYDAALEPRIHEFYRIAFSEREPDLCRLRWQWMFLRSAERLEVDPRVWVYVEDGKVVAHHGAIPVRVKIGSQLRTTGWHVDTKVLEAYRPRALGGQLVAQASDDSPFGMSLGQTADSRQMLKHLGWEQVATLQVAHLLLRPERVLSGKLARPMASAAGLAMRASTLARALVRSKTSYEVRMLTKFDERHDQLWNDVQRELTCAAVRDASYLNWKWVDQPGQDLVRIELVEGNQSRGVAVISIREPNEHYPYRRAFLVDLLVPFSDERLVRQLVIEASRAAVDRDADSLICMHVGKPLERVLRQCSFIFREPTRYLFVSTSGLSEATRLQVLEESNWFLTQGDSDIDRPE